MDLDKLEALAKAATPGPWHVVNNGLHKDWSDSNVEGSEFYDDNGNDNNQILGHSRSNATYVAAVNPSVVLELLVEIRRLQDEASCWRCQVWRL